MIKLRRNYIIYISILLFFLGTNPNSIFAQYSTVRIFELKSVTDSLGIDHIFFRLQEEHDNGKFYRNNIYKINANDLTETLFLEDYFDSRFGFEARVQIIDYIFFNSNPEKYLYIEQFCEFDCYGSVRRGESNEDLFGGLYLFADYLISDNKDSGNVYISFGGNFIIGENGGRDWPSESLNEVPDSSIYNFPLTSLNPYNNEIMFGLSFEFAGQNNGWIKSIDGGKTEDFISDTLIANNIVYDADSLRIYFIDTINVPNQIKNCSTEQCLFGLYTIENIHESFDWILLKSFYEPVSLSTHPNLSGVLYISTKNKIYMSGNAGASFIELVSDDLITGMTVSNENFYYSNGDNIFRQSGSGFLPIKTIPTSSEYIGLPPRSFGIISNYPNPFNPTTTVTFEVNTMSEVELGLYSINGQFVRDLFKGTLVSGEYNLELDASALSSGIYIIIGRINDKILTHKITLIK